MTLPSPSSSWSVDSDGNVTASTGRPAGLRRIHRRVELVCLRCGSRFNARRDRRYCGRPCDRMARVV